MSNDYTLPPKTEGKPKMMTIAGDRMELEEGDYIDFGHWLSPEWCEAYGHACRAPLAEENARLLARVAESDDYVREANKLLDEFSSERDRLRADLAAKAGEVEALRGFAQKVMEAWPECGVDGFDLEEYAKEFGLIESTRVQGPCGEDCACLAACADWPTDCYHRTALLTGSGPWVNPLAAEVEKYRAGAERLSDFVLSHHTYESNSYATRCLDCDADVRNEPHKKDCVVLIAARKGEGVAGA